MSWEKIVQLMGMGEGQNVEFKKTLLNSNDLAKDIVAFANAKGGYIVLGIDDKNGHLVGETASKEWILAIASSKCNQALQVSTLSASIIRLSNLMNMTQMAALSAAGVQSYRT